MEKAPGYKMTDTAAAEGGNNSNEYVKTENESNANEDEDQTLKRVGRKKRPPTDFKGRTLQFCGAVAF